MAKHEIENQTKEYIRKQDQRVENLHAVLLELSTNVKKIGDVHTAWKEGDFVYSMRLTQCNLSKLGEIGDRFMPLPQTHDTVIVMTLDTDNALTISLRREEKDGWHSFRSISMRMPGRDITLSGAIDNFEYAPKEVLSGSEEHMKNFIEYAPRLSYPDRLGVAEVMVNFAVQGYINTLKHDSKSWLTVTNGDFEHPILSETEYPDSSESRPPGVSIQG